MAPRAISLAHLGLSILPLAGRAAAANIPLQNCLSPGVNGSTQLQQLQFLPWGADAVFNTTDSSHNLSLRIWGNITGTLDSTLPPSLNDTSYWTNSSNTNGKIINYSPASTYDATFFAHYYVTGYMTPSQPGNQDFCQLTKQDCPLIPFLNATDNNGQNQLPEFNFTQPMLSGWGFTSINAIFSVSAAESGAEILCVSTEITPYLGDTPANLLRYLPVLVLLLVAIATASAAFSPWGTFNIYHWTSNYGRDEDQLRLITPGFGDCLAYIQFIVLSGSLALNYPGFFQPAISRVSWSTLMFNESFWSHSEGVSPIVDGVYSLAELDPSVPYNGMTRVRQLVGMGADNDVWPGFMVWLLVIIGCLIAIIQLGYVFRLLYRFATRTSEEDLRAKNWPLTIGNVIRVVFNYFLLPLIAFCIYQMSLAGISDSPAYVVALAVITLVILLCFSGWLLYQILSTHPRSFLFTDLPTLLMYGPLYNTYSDAAAPFALVPMLINLIRGIAIGAIQASGIAQIVVMAVAEVLLLVALNAFRPFSSPTSMNLYHTAFSIVRLVILLLMVAFVHELNAPNSVASWIGYVILFLHGLTLFVGFFLHSLQTLIEVTARALGAGGEGTAAKRGGLVKVFGVRQLSRRNPRRSGRARGSMASDAQMLQAEVEADSQSFGQGGMRSRSMSASSAFLLNSRQAGSGRQSLLLDNLSQGGAHETAASSNGNPHTPGTPSGPPSMFSYMPSATQVGTDPTTRRTSGMTAMTGVMAGQKPPEPADPYYRPPRARRGTNDPLNSPATMSAGSGDWSKRGDGRQSASDEAEPYRDDPTNEFTEDPDAPKPDYATREVDYYYGVRGPALNDQPTRKLKTGPADPTGPVSSATGWFRNMFGGKTKDKHKGFEVVRGKGIRQGMEPGTPVDETIAASPREPYRDEPGTPVPAATTASRKLDLEDEADAIGAGTRRIPGERPSGPLEELGIRRTPSNAPILPDIDSGSSIHMPSRMHSMHSNAAPLTAQNSVRYRDGAFGVAGVPEPPVPSVPRKSSRRHSAQGSRDLGVDSSVGGSKTQLPTIVQSPTASPASANRTRGPSLALAGTPGAAGPDVFAGSGGLSRMPFGSLGSESSARPNILQRASTSHSAVSDLEEEENPRVSFQQPPSPMEPPPDVLRGALPPQEEGRRGSANSATGSIGYVSQHRASENIVTMPTLPIFNGSAAELVEGDGGPSGLQREYNASPGAVSGGVSSRGHSRSPQRAPDGSTAHINF